MTTSTMTAWQVEAHRLRLLRVPVPEPGPDETLVRVSHTGLCGSDIAKLTRTPIPSPGAGWRPGHEIAGWDLGTTPATPVAVNPLLPCGTCPPCRTGAQHRCPRLRRVGWDEPGGFASFVRVPQANVYPLPGELPLSHAALADPVAVAVHGLHGLQAAAGRGTGRAGPGRLAVVGSGAVAVSTAGIAAEHGWQVTLFAHRPAPLGQLTDVCGITVARSGSATRGDFDVVIDAATGHDDTPLAQALDLVGDGGRIIVQTAYAEGVRLRTDLREVFRRSVTLTGSFSYCAVSGDDFTQALDLLRRRPAWARPLTNGTRPLQDLPTALDRIARRDPRRPVKVLLTPGGEP
jgi:threonine dehydrogenase-like Zn-dependent dehydrogenase